MAISNDQELRKVLDELPTTEQRDLGCRFVVSVRHLSEDPRIGQALEVIAERSGQPDEMLSAYKGVKALSNQTYTACGRDADWAIQAEHFVAAAAVACLLPEGQISNNTNLAWKAAVQARMAKNCEMILNDAGEVDNEAQKQYAIAEAFISENG
ncbi:MAG: hypothetical protein DIZ78_16665 [endosymbiont of Escarpia spicata]|uniref:Uncharacterized protein n=1 Tax=endosymbiont of Escarpia spicata TaxID=2200908 RepID=A0A370DBW0_9GAMM|nr:MAG: hypothetical protein DIZ78_16665 [endosymbiont of Escarpia spicata]